MSPLQAAVNWEFKRESVDFSLSPQMELRLMARLDAPSVAPAAEVVKLKSYRHACQMAWEARRVKRMTRKTLAEITGMYASHVTEYLSADETQREMPARFIPAFEQVAGNTIVTQWLALQARLTVLEEVQALKVAA